MSLAITQELICYKIISSLQSWVGLICTMYEYINHSYKYSTGLKMYELLLFQPNLRRFFFLKLFLRPTNFTHQNYTPQWFSAQEVLHPSQKLIKKYQRPKSSPVNGIRGNCASMYLLETPSPPEMEITKNKNPQARLQIFYRYFNPYLRVWWFSFWKSQIFGKSLETFGSRIFFLRF